MGADEHDAAERHIWRIDDKLVAAWPAAYAAGDTIRGIADRWDVNPTTVRRHLGVTGRSRGPADAPTSPATRSKPPCARPAPSPAPAPRGCSV